MMRLSFRIAVTLGLFVCLKFVLTNSIVSAQEWPQFRGPHGSGIADATTLPVTWSETENVTWKTELPGRGWSSPVISGKYIWMTTGIETAATPEELAKKFEGRSDAKSLQLAAKVSLRAICVDRESGKLIQNVPLFELDYPDPIHALNSYASPTPVICGDRVFCHFGNYGTACVGLADGKVLWKTEQFKYDPQNGPGASPVAWKNLLIFNCDGRDVQFIVALDQADGKTVWQTNRSGKLPDNNDFKKAYCTPTIIDDPQHPQLISPASDWVYSYDPATGQELWRANYGQLGFSTVPKPLIGNGKVYVLTSFMSSRLLAIKFDGHGDVTETHVNWKEDRNMPSKPSMLLIDDRLYAVNDKGILTCLDANSGEMVWRERVDGDYAASPLYGAGHIYLFNQNGETTVVQPGDEFKKVASNKLDGSFMASPAVAGNALFLRTDKALYRVEE